MKKALAVACAVWISCVLKAQTPEEWLQQQQTQKKYLVKQISSLHEYLGYVQKGFAIAEKGLTTISSIKHGDFNLHDAFFSSLKEVNPGIKKYSRVADVVSLQQQILSDYKKSRQLTLHGSQLDRDEILYVNKVFEQMLSLSYQNIDELSLITSAGKSEMKDDERIKRIDKLYIDMVSKVSFTQYFLNEVKSLIENRGRDRNDISSSRILNSIKNN
jgi:hypothetical protein